ncbi:non-hemolytic phospholipase C [Longispora fulva]|uniref:phospholipase C n=1 Tax=Longispora fulva TaxID=619741 RepID=A0A8J7KE90_9ACTN|nr:phospholipase C, phosphocholine-specific [Longispora fulva]MBG6134880.1 phospholipase C [Longispora fulva]GIG56888.1 non-hemolytic phospholipase C [Longispora fulva]
MEEHNPQSTVSRRRVLGMTAGAAGVAAATALPGIGVADAVTAAPAEAAAAATGTIADVEHVVIFMQENRAFDHYYGTMRGVRGFADPTAIRLPSGKSVFHQPYPSNPDGYILPFRMNTGTTSAICANAPAMNYSTDIAIYNNGKYDAWNTARTPGLGMGTFTRADLPFYYSLADAFTICDHNFQSTFTQTNPNRLHLFTGSNGLSVGQSAVLDNTEPAAGFTWTTYAERLEAAGVSWKVYQENDNFDDNAFAWFKNFKNASTSSALYTKGLAKQADFVKAFGDDVAAGTLPQVSWIIAPANLSEHANYKPAYGEDLTARLLAKLAANPAVYDKTVFILNYDENGGFYDHVPPPVPATSSSNGLSTVSTTGEINSGSPIGLGFRVPMILVSPWSRGGWVCSEVFDHTSVLRFLEKRFGVAEPNISAWRRSVTGDLTSAFDFANPNTTWPSLPSTTGYPSGADTQCSTLPAPGVPAAQALPAQESGTRPARALPYTLAANGRVASDKFWIDFANTGTSGAHFTLYANQFRTDGPWRYTVEAGKTLSDYIAAGTPTGSYDVTAIGPNGFLRQFAGNRVTATTSGNANPEVTLRYAPTEGKVYLDMKNSGTKACTVTVKANRYRTDGPWNYAVAAGATVTDSWNVAPASNWYDLTATANTTDGFLRRFAGHMETGAPSTSDPAFGTATPVPGPLPVTVTYFDSQETVGENGAAVNAVDGNPATIWHTQWSSATAPLPHELQLDAGASKSLTGLTYTPRQDGGSNGRVGQYEIATSVDGTTWTVAATGTFPDTAAAKTVTFATAVNGRYVRFRALTEAGNRGPWTSAAAVTPLGL